MFYKMLFDRFVGFAYLYTVLDMPRQIRIVCLQKVTVLCFVNNGKTQHRARATSYWSLMQCYICVINSVPTGTWRSSALPASVNQFQMFSKWQRKMQTQLLLLYAVTLCCCSSTVLYHRCIVCDVKSTYNIRCLAS